MRRVAGTARPDWHTKITEQGLGFHDRVPQGQGRPYWDESVHWEFTMAEVLALEAQVGELHRMCLAAAEHVVLSDRMGEYGIEPWLHEPIRRSWSRRDPHVFGRFDLSYDGCSPAKLLEYNADTPTSLVETAVVQWWLYR